MNREQALVALGRELRASGYRFVTVTPATHARVVARAPALASSLRDVFGWSRPFAKDVLPAKVFDLLGAANALGESGGVFRSRVRFSSLAGELFVHSAYPTADAGAVFFGPDTYRFCAAIARACATAPATRVVDIGCGTGAGGLVAGRAARRIVLADVNDEALVHARVNVALADRVGVEVEVVASDVFARIEGTFDLVVANPPYMKDELHRTYRDGGGAFGEALALRILRESIERLAPGGTLLLYTGAAVIDGEDALLRAAAPLLDERRFAYTYEEVDPDVFGEELERPGYATVDRIAAVVLRASRARA